MRVAIIGAGVGGLAAATRLAAAGHAVTVLEQADRPGGKCGSLDLEGLRFDTGPSLLTMPWVLEELFAAIGTRLEDELELVRVEPVTRYRFADSSELDLSADLPRALTALEEWSPGSGADWTRFLGACGGMWRASVPFLSRDLPWPPGPRALRNASGAAPGDLLRVRPWSTLAGLSRSLIRDPRLRMVVERFATYAGGDPQRSPAALAVAGFVEHAFGAWHVRGGLSRIVDALTRRLEALGGELRLSDPVREIAVRGGRASGVEADGGHVDSDAVVSTADVLALRRDLLPRSTVDPAPHAARRTGRSLSGFALMLALRGRAEHLPHHTILFPSDYRREFDDVFSRRRPVTDPAIYLSSPATTEDPRGAADREGVFLLVNAPCHGNGMDWDREGPGYERAVLARLAERGLDVRERLIAGRRRTPADLERETGSPGGAIYGAAPHGRMASLRRPPIVPRHPRGLYLVGGGAHPGGGLPLVMMAARTAAGAVEARR